MSDLHELKSKVQTLEIRADEMKQEQSKTSELLTAQAIHNARQDERIVTLFNTASQLKDGLDACETSVKENTITLERLPLKLLLSMGSLLVLLVGGGFIAISWAIANQEKVRSFFGG